MRALTGVCVGLSGHTTPQTLPDSYHQWAEMTIVGRVLGLGPGKEPLLKMVYGRGWGLTSAHDGVWEHVKARSIVALVRSGA